MSIDVTVFSPASSYIISATAASSDTALTQPPNVTDPNSSAQTAGNAGGYTVIRAYNSSTTVVAFLSFGNSTQTATTSSPYVLPPAATMTYEIPTAATHVGAIMETSGTVKLYLMLGNS